MWVKTAGGQQCFSSFYHSMSPQHNILPVPKGTENTDFFFVFQHSLFLFILPLCVYVCTQHNCSILSGFSPCYPLKKRAQNRISATIMPETHCVDSRHFSCKTLKSLECDLQCNGRGAAKSVCYENKNKNIFKKNEISTPNCSSSNACSIVCRPHFTK